MQKLALMMAVMMLGMTPAHGCSTSIDLGGQGVGGQAEMILPLSMWSRDDGKALMTEGRISLTTAKGGPPVEPGGLPVKRILQQIQLGVEGLVRIRNEVLRVGQGAAKENPEDREYKPGSGGEWPRQQAQERSSAKGDGRSEEGRRRNQGQRP